MRGAMQSVIPIDYLVDERRSGARLGPIVACGRLSVHARGCRAKSRQLRCTRRAAPRERGRQGWCCITGEACLAVPTCRITVRGTSRTGRWGGFAGLVRDTEGKSEIFEAG
jgi:hypothetical protein